MGHILFYRININQSIDQSVNQSVNQSIGAWRHGQISNKHNKTELGHSCYVHIYSFTNKAKVSYFDKQRTIIGAIGLYDFTSVN